MSREDAVLGKLARPPATGGNVPSPTPAADPPRIEVGQWWWVRMYEGDAEERFACVTDVGSNYATVKSPWGSENRIHFDHWDKRCRREPDPGAVIRREAAGYRDEVRGKLAEIRTLMARLGVADREKLGHGAISPSAERSLAVLSGTEDLDRYKGELAAAKSEKLPALFKEVEEAHRNLAVWMKAESLPLEGAVGAMKGSIGRIEERIEDVSLYAGLAEKAVEISGGEPARSGEKLHVFQRLLFMDEECLLDYRHGGMEFKDLSAFDRWLAEPARRDRILPFPRSLVAFRVRRNPKERDWKGSIRILFSLESMQRADESTYLYIRNGERLFRIDCGFEFGELLFPGRRELDLTEPMMAEDGGVGEIIPRREWEDRVRTKKDGMRAYLAWKKAHRGKSDYDNPHHKWTYNEGHLDRFHPFDRSNVWYDDVERSIGSRVRYFNRIALIVQGVYDRSEILHPHPPVRLFTAEGLEAACRLVYDGEGIHHGESPDFEAYRARLNAGFRAGSIAVGQDEYWAEKEGERESRRMDRDWRVKQSEYRPRVFRPYGNPGPGFLAAVAEWHPRTKRAVFLWTRRSRTYGHADERYGCSLSVPSDRLLNVSAYRPGDFRRFYLDPRTRAQYLDWAPYLIAAEEYHAGNLKPGPAEE